ncbi:MAG: hypothetical protein ACOC6G_02910 [Thermoproteota archaeon]
MPVRAREGEFIETFEGLLFDVKGLIHPPNRIIAFIRYFPDQEGNRKRGDKPYGKVYSLQKRYQLLKKRYPKYLVYDRVLDTELCEVPKRSIKKIHNPVEKLDELRKCEDPTEPEEQALRLAEYVKESSGIPWSSIGISGSIMVDTYTPNSDIDPVIYGSENCLKAYSTLRELLDDPSIPLQAYTQKGLKDLFHFRSKDTHMGYEDFVKTESRKVNQGKIFQKDFFIRFVKDWKEVTQEYGDIEYQNKGYATVRGVVADDSQSLFTPCKYYIEEAEYLEGSQKEKIQEISSFRGRFCDQAREGEGVIAQGKVEQVTDHRENREYLRLLIGNRPEDYMILA